MRQSYMGAAPVALVAGLAFLLAFYGIGDQKATEIPTESRTYSVNFQPTDPDPTVPRRETDDFNMVAVTWPDSHAHLSVTVLVRTRSVHTGTWSKWLPLEDLSPDSEGGAARGGSHPVWTGKSDGVEARVLRNRRSAIQGGLRLDLIDVGANIASMHPAVSKQTAQGAETSARPAQSGTASRWNYDGALRPETQPPITSRGGWDAQESLSREQPRYVSEHGIRAVVIHHTAESNDYSCADAPKIIRGIHHYHVKQLGWKDIGYNFLVDKCGVIYEGRKGGVDQPVHGAHTRGFNSQTVGVAVLGTHAHSPVSHNVLTSLARLASWKLFPNGVDPASQVVLNAISTGSNYDGKRWGEGERIRVPAVLGHRHAYNTECPGEALSEQLETVRSWASGPVTGLTVHSVTQFSDSANEDRGNVAVEWRANTPVPLISRVELISDGEVIATTHGTASYLTAQLTEGVHDIHLRAIHQSGKAASATPVRVVIEKKKASPADDASPQPLLLQGPGLVDHRWWDLSGLPRG
ncbi:peptidoglycan recognition protein family protein [Streptomyces lavendulocolor]|uniref:peptidoglycan recognition protein family protein n=1 Tax=Streptomyces lavendulocolor TaxID=67316 RepID=UPI00340C6B9F